MLRFRRRPQHPRRHATRTRGDVLAHEHVLAAARQLERQAEANDATPGHHNVGGRRDALVLTPIRHSLRWHYPDQVRGVGSPRCPLSPLSAGSPSLNPSPTYYYRRGAPKTERKVLRTEQCGVGAGLVPARTIAREAGDDTW